MATLEAKRKMSIVTYGGWFNTFQRPHHFARYLTRRFDTYVANNIVGLPFRGYGYMAEQKDLVGKISDIFILKEGERFPLIAAVNKALIRVQSFFKFRAREFRDSEVVYTWHIEDLGYLEHCRGKVLIYDAMDDWAAFSETREQRLIDNENALVARADIVLAVSRKLYDRHRQLNSNTYLVPNGVDTEFFGRVRCYGKRETDTLHEYRDRPVVGYVGGIHDWVDVDLIVETALLLPDISFVLIGPALKSLKQKLEGIPNLAYLGPKPYSDLVGYMSYFSVGIIPFKLNLLNESTNPIKLYEYLGAGLPVVSTSMKEVVPHAAEGVVYVADEPAAFAERIREAISTADDARHVRERQRIAGDNSWEERAGLLLDLIDAALDRRSTSGCGS
jgi:glycosyltransferase involved in cell wall biosynthesis